MMRFPSFWRGANTNENSSNSSSGPQAVGIVHTNQWHQLDQRRLVRLHYRNNAHAPASSMCTSMPPIDTKIETHPLRSHLSHDAGEPIVTSGNSSKRRVVARVF
ncbi:Arylsulfatase D [Anopheles sinensis]|uniref:Arylsulfatase D n=1 Tax=Anopheles sinensis TaxID=74873 RepID=A0A084WSH2_ANOSI|nr:Arylsulfatase D [Anopheles sinensis]